VRPEPGSSGERSERGNARVGHEGERHRARDKLGVLGREVGDGGEGETPVGERAASERQGQGELRGGGAAREMTDPQK